MNAACDVKLLLVDDRDQNLAVLSAMLRGDGLELLSARSGREALELLLIHDVALALLDVQMPDMDGFELAESMRGTERTRHVPIIFITAGSHDAQRMFRGYDVGGVDFLFKPIDSVLLRHKVSTFVDLHRQRLERERLADELREALRLNELFVAAVSHDLRSPLMVLRMGAEVLDRSIVDPDARRTLNRMRSSADRILSMLEQLYDLARARLGGGITIDPRVASFRILADKVLDELRLAHPERRLQIAYVSVSMDGVWDELRLAQVLTNLVGNAIRHGTPGEAVDLIVDGSPNSLSFEVHNGGEIPEAIRPHLFEAFRDSSLPRARDSLGLGLYIVRQIVLAHGGTIAVTSSQESGTTFRVELPRQARSGAAPAN
jgi:signal transduction histidine kinase